jgi:hypothetical protein
LSSLRVEEAETLASALPHMQARDPVLVSVWATRERTRQAERELAQQTEASYRRSGSAIDCQPR